MDRATKKIAKRMSGEDLRTLIDGVEGSLKGCLRVEFIARDGEVAGRWATSVIRRLIVAARRGITE